MHAAQAACKPPPKQAPPERLSSRANGAPSVFGVPKERSCSLGRSRGVVSRKPALSVVEWGSASVFQGTSETTHRVRPQKLPTAACIRARVYSCRNPTPKNPERSCTRRKPRATSTKAPPRRGCHPERTGPQAYFGVPKERSCSLGRSRGVVSRKPALSVVEWGSAFVFQKTLETTH